MKLHGQGQNITSIAKILEVHRNTVSDWIKRYDIGGMKALAKKRRGPKPGTTLQLDASAQSVIRKFLIEKRPEQMKLPFALWTREAVGLLMRDLTGKELDLRQVGRYLKRWGFTPQRPLKRAYQRSEEK